MIEILRTGPLCTVQDLGRPGWAAIGVPRAGAFDRAAARRANRLVGNDDRAALLEVTLGGLALRALDAVTVALTGAACPGIDFGVAVTLARGATVAIRPPVAGLRSYLAVRGGLAVGSVLGSCSTDTLSGLGPQPVQPGDRIPVGPAPERLPGAVSIGVAPVTRVLPIGDGPRVDWFEPGALDRLTGTEWTVRAESDRVGIRLDGPPLTRARTEELPSEPTRPGAVQVPADGRPIVFGPDAPVTGGYPVLAVVNAAALDAAAQWRPGDRVRFVRSPLRGRVR